MLKAYIRNTFYFTFFLTVFFCQAQPKSLQKGQYSLEEILVILDQDYNLAYSINTIPGNAKISLSTDTPYGELFDIITKQSNVTFNRQGNTYIVTYEPQKPHKYVIKGYVRDRDSGEPLIGSTVYLVGTNQGVVTNHYGYYSLTLPAKSYEIACSFIGYTNDSIKVDLKSNISYDFDLSLRLSELEEVTVSSREPQYNIKSIIPGVNTIDLQTEGQIPYFLGEVDVLQGALLMPGIRTIGEDASGINVRGGDVDQNLLLLDESIIYNPNHFYGLISVFNPEAVNSIEIMKGFMPPSYGGRASSVITVNQKEGNDEEFSVTGGIGLVSARLIAEGPIKREKSSFIISGRQSIANLSVLGNTSSGLSRNNANFQDFNAKINLKINSSNTVHLAGYFGNDRNRTGFDAIRNWGNRNLSVRWNHLFGPRLFSNFTSTISEYAYKITDPQEAGSFVGKSNIENYSSKVDMAFSISPQQELTFGAGTIYYRLLPGERIPFDENASSRPFSLDTENAFESSAYIGHQLKIGNWFSSLYGLRYSSLVNLGPSTVYSYAPQMEKNTGNIIDSTFYKKGEIVKNFDGLEPRLSLNFSFNSAQALKASYGRTYQYLHLISNTVIPSPTDIWKISDTYIPPIRSDHYSVGFYQNLKNNMFETSLEVYYKPLQNIIEYKNGANLLFNPNIETEILTGISRSYGLEFFIKKNTGRVTGWISYTLSRSELKVKTPFPDQTINSGRFFPANHDKLHDISIVSIMKLSERWALSGTFNYSSGRPITLPAGKYEFEGNLVPHFQDRNLNNLPDYHRLDLSVKWDGRQFRKDGTPKKYHDYWTFVVYNVYGRKNAYSLIFRKSEEDPNITEAVPFTIFDSPIPAITYNFRF
ncbi:MAG: carboxypeptidase-like regulatory domain-containing protein [Bacteroidota bacterium]